MAVLRWSEAALAVKAEAAEGTAEALTAAEAKVRVENVALSPEIPFSRRETVSASLSRFTGTATGPRLWRLTFDVPLAGSGVAGTAPSWGVLLNGCLTTEAIVGGTSVTYTPSSSSSDDKSLTVGLYVDGMRFLLNGARCNPKMVFNSGDVPMLQFEVLGGYNEPTDVAIPGSISYESTVAASLLGGTFTFGASSLLCKSLEIDFGNVLVPRLDPTTANGIYSVAIAKRNITGSMTLEQELVATFNFFNKLTTNVESALVYGPFGAAGNIITVNGPKVQMEKVDPVNADDLAAVALGLLFNRNAGDDEVSLLLA